MKMNKQLIEAAEMLKENCCDKSCGRCVFWADGNCGIKGLPSLWCTQKPRRWTDEDIALAKALKAFGAKQIYHYLPDTIVWEADNNVVGVVPGVAFADLDYDERLHIDDIIDEVENNG